MTVLGFRAGEESSGSHGGAVQADAVAEACSTCGTPHAHLETRKCIMLIDLVTLRCHSMIPLFDSCMHQCAGKDIKR